MTLQRCDDHSYFLVSSKKIYHFAALVTVFTTLLLFTTSKTWNSLGTFFNMHIWNYHVKRMHQLISKNNFWTLSLICGCDRHSYFHSIAHNVTRASTYNNMCLLSKVSCSSIKHSIFFKVMKSKLKSN